MGMMGVFLIPVFAETFLGYTATQAGYLFMPMAAALILASPIGGSLIGKVKAKYVIFASTLVAALGLWMFSWYLDIRSTPWDIIFPLFIMAFGLGFGMAQRTNIVASVVPAKEIGVASSILALARNIAGAFGVSVFATLLTYISEKNVLTIAKWSTIRTTNPAMVSQFVGSRGSQRPSGGIRERLCHIGRHRFISGASPFFLHQRAARAPRHKSPRGVIYFFFKSFRLHSLQRASYKSFAPTRTCPPSEVFLWEILAIPPQTTQIAWSFVT